MDDYGPKYRPYNRSNIYDARKMRQKPTPAEEKMREGILKHRPLGYKFTRQKPIGSFIVDFYCAKLSLAIEVDGEIHKKRRQYDRERSNSLSNQGVSIARYRNNDVLTKIDTVYKDLLQFMKKLANQ